MVTLWYGDVVHARLCSRGGQAWGWGGFRELADGPDMLVQCVTSPLWYGDVVNARLCNRGGQAWG